MRRGATALAALLLVAGCADPAVDEAPEAVASSPGVDPEPSPPTGDERDGPTDVAVRLVQCDGDLLATLDDLVGGQLEAFVAGDYERALTFSSDGFAADFTPEALRGVIEGGFPLVARADDYRVGACEVTEGGPDHVPSAFMDVTVLDAEADALDLRYLFALDDDWGIAGAGPPVDGTDDGVVT